jgi:hypothetical protein
MFLDNYYSQFYHPFTNWHNSTFLPLLWQFFLILKSRFTDMEIGDQYSHVTHIYLEETGGEKIHVSVNLTR